MRVSAKTLAKMQPRRPKPRPRGNSNHPAFKAAQFKKGQSGNPGGKPKFYVRMATKLADELAMPAPAPISKALGLKKGATKYDACLASMLHCAMTGDWQAALGIREVIEGKLPNRSLNISASLERMLQDADFRQFVDQQLQSYLAQKGETYEPGIGSGSDAFAGSAPAIESE